MQLIQLINMEDPLAHSILPILPLHPTPMTPHLNIISHNTPSPSHTLILSYPYPLIPSPSPHVHCSCPGCSQLPSGTAGTPAARQTSASVPPTGPGGRRPPSSGPPTSPGSRESPEGSRGSIMERGGGGGWCQHCREEMSEQ